MGSKRGSALTRLLGNAFLTLTMLCVPIYLSVILRETHASGFGPDIIATHWVQLFNLVFGFFTFFFYNFAYVQQRASDVRNYVRGIGAKRASVIDREALAGHKWDVFLTHDWGMDSVNRRNHPRVARINTALRRAGIETWFDEERLEGNILEQMTDGIDESRLVVVFVTKNYMLKVAGRGEKGRDDNCRAEFEYACNRKGVDRMLSVVTDPAALDARRWRGAVGMKLGTRLYVDLSDDDDASFDRSLAKLVDEIRRNLEVMSHKHVPRDVSAVGRGPDLSNRDASSGKAADLSGKVCSELPDLRAMPPSATAAGAPTTKLAGRTSGDRDDAVAALDRL